MQHISFKDINNSPHTSCNVLGTCKALGFIFLIIPILELFFIQIEYTYMIFSIQFLIKIPKQVNVPVWELDWGIIDNTGLFPIVLFRSCEESQSTLLCIFLNVAT